MLPDGMLGAVVGSESLGLSETMVNGAGGCRSRSQILIHELLPSYEREDPGCCRSKYFSRQSRLPCTYLNNNDIVFGSGHKVSEGIGSVASVTGRRMTLVDTLASSLICTDYSGLTGRAGSDPIMLEGDLSGMGFSDGYDLAVSSILEASHLDGGEDGSVNLLGYSIADPGWETGCMELRSLLGAMGLRANIVGCREPLDSLGKASVNVLVRPEMSGRTAASIGRMYGIGSIRPTMGAPVGYDATRSFVREVAEATGRDPTPALDMIDRDAEQVHRVLMNFDRLPMGLHSKGFVIESGSSTAYPLMRWLHETFGMAPRMISVTDDAYVPEIEGFLDSVGYPEAMSGGSGEVEMVFTDGLSALEGRIRNDGKGYVEVGMPRGRTLDLLGRCTIGLRGCRYLLDEMFNTAMRFRCGQPTEVDYRPCCGDGARGGHS